MIEGIVLLYYMIATLGVVGIILGANWYDVKAVHSRQQFQAHPGRRQFRHRPQVTITLIASSNPIVTRRSVESLMKISYRKCTILVVGAKKSAVKTKLQNKSIRFVKKMPAVGAGRGELVLSLTDERILAPDAISRAVWHLNNYPHINGVMFALRPRFYPSHTHLFTMYLLCVSSLFYKTASIFGHVRPNLASPTMWRRDAVHTLSPQRVIYAEDAWFSYNLAAHSGLLQKTQHNRIWGNTVFRLIACFSFFILLYATWVAAWQHQPTLFGLALLLLALLALPAIWWNYHLSLLHKMAYTLALPVSFGYLYGWLTMIALKTFADVAKTVVPIGVGLFARIKNILRVVESL